MWFMVCKSLFLLQITSPVQSVPITTKVVSSWTWRGALNTTLCDKVCHWLVTSCWCSPGTLVSSTNKTVVVIVGYDLAPNGMFIQWELKGQVIISTQFWSKANRCGLWFIVFNATFNNITVMSLAVSFIDGGNQRTWRTPTTCRKTKLISGTI
jgi:hypothetical protein